MANRAYLFSLDNRPASYADRPETIRGLSEWPSIIPFSYRVLMSGNPGICASLISDGFENEPAHAKTRLHAIASDFEPGFSRLSRLIGILQPIAADDFPALAEALQETQQFLEARRNRHLLLETIELDCMMNSGEDALRVCVEREIAECIRAGAAIDALPSDLRSAGAVLLAATEHAADPPLDAMFGLRIDDEFDNTYGGMTDYPLGLVWYEDLYYRLRNRTEFAADR